MKTGVLRDQTPFTKLTKTEKLLICIKYSEAQVRKSCPSKIIFLCKSLEYCALGTVGTYEHSFHTHLIYEVYSLLNQPKLRLGFFI